MVVHKRLHVSKIALLVTTDASYLVVVIMYLVVVITCLEVVIMYL